LDSIRHDDVVDIDVVVVVKTRAKFCDI
jgi:hypothetical protein